MAQNLVAEETNFRQLSSDYSKKATEVKDVKDFLRRQLKSSVWEGKAATSFRSDWDRYEKVLNEIHDLFDGLSKELKSRGDWTGEFEKRKRS